MKRRLWLGAALVLGALAILGQVLLFRARPIGSPVLAESAFAAFGGFRSLLAEIAWFRADRLQDEGRYVELAQLAHMLTAAEPHTPEVWSYAAYNLAYNVSVMMPTPEDRWRWVDAALSLLRDEGLKYNPTSLELHRELAWIFELKMAAKLDSAAPYYRKVWRARVEDVAARDAWEELGMDRALMAEIEARFKVKDRGNPCYSSIYWAWHGLKSGNGPMQAALAGIIKQSLFLYGKVGI